MTAHPVYFLYPGDLDTPTGGYRYDRRLIRELQALGRTVHPVALSERFPAPDTEALDHAARQLNAIPDQAVVLIDGLALGVMAAVLAGQARRLRLVALCHHPLALESGLTEAEARALADSERRALAMTRAVIVTSVSTGRILSECFAVPEQHLVVTVPGTDRVPFAAADSAVPRLLSVASLTPRKGHDVLVEALARLTDLSWQARFVGSAAFDPVWAESLYGQVNRHRLGERIRCTGAVEDLQAEYRHADLFVLPSRFEGYGMVFAEALAAGLPVVAARAGAVPDVVPEQAGRLVPADDPEALTQVLRDLLTDTALRLRLRDGARQVAADLPTWQDSARRVARLIEEIEAL